MSVCGGGGGSPVVGPYCAAVEGHCQAEQLCPGVIISSGWGSSTWLQLAQEEPAALCWDTQCSDTALRQPVCLQANIKMKACHTITDRPARGAECSTKAWTWVWMFSLHLNITNEHKQISQINAFVFRLFCFSNFSNFVGLFILCCCCSCSQIGCLF